MDPQSLAFTPQSDLWRLSTALRSFQEVQQEHNERLVRIERRQDEDARIKSVWGSSSPFPGVLSGMVSQGTMSQGAGDDFTTFDDDQSSSMIRGLHLDNEEEPRRFGAASRANSVRFDESAKQGQWAHTSRTSSDFIPSRTSSGLNGLGGHPLFERTMSHKSDGRHSSAGQSAISGRANSFGLDTSQSIGQTAVGTPGLAPGLFILGSVPAIIRCWINNKFTHEALLYAVICTGSYKSFLDFNLIKGLGLSGRIIHDLNGTRRIKLAVYLPEAVPHPASSRSSSSTPQLPTVTIDFNVIQETAHETDSRTVQIYIGSDILRAHNATILFSSNSLTLFDDEQHKLSIPLVRPENDETFKSLRLTNSSVQASKAHHNTSEAKAGESILQPPAALAEAIGISGDNFDSSKLRERQSTSQAPNEGYSESRSPLVTDPTSVVSSPKAYRQSEQIVKVSKPQSITGSDNKHEIREVPEEGLVTLKSTQTNSSTGVWNHWRRESSSGAFHGDWANVSRNGGNNAYQRPNREHGIKVLKPMRQVSRSSAIAAVSPSNSTHSRFFDDGKRISRSASASDETETSRVGLKRSVSGGLGKSVGKENASTSSGSKQMKGTNPIGGASAFGWLNPH